MTSVSLQKRIVISEIKHGIVAARPGQMYAWPGMIKISKEEILVGASERLEHRGPGGREVIIRSKDGGKSWGLPQEIYNSELDDRDANLAVLSDGKIILSWFTSAAFNKCNPERYNRITKKMRQELFGSWMCISEDDGYTWSEAQRIPGGVHISPVVLSDDSLITVDTDSTDTECLAVYKSNDLGKTWKLIGGIPSPKCWVSDSGSEKFILNENHIIEIARDKLCVVLRSDPLGDGYLYQSFSNDNGTTWSEPHKTGLKGFPPHLLRLSNGVIMCTYSDRGTPHCIRVIFSYDDAQTWDIENIIILYQWEDSPDMGYPVSVETTPGNILMIFYCSYRMKTKKIYNYPEGILSLRFKVTAK